ncbi:MAG: hypothetical protein KA175_12550 [Flavobacteriales bacterium]|nr:hypothetical protein [Flavobacteriales bacterium]MBP6698444.1 hypothetical protein [Flavobacteriales bacterium]
MRFLPHEHAAITTALRRHDIDPVFVLFVKRRGRLHVEIPGHGDAFVFFREKSTRLDEHGRWQDCVRYFIGMGRTAPCGWEQVLAEFENWLTVGGRA